MDSKVIVITGAGGVLCGAFARALAGDGHRLALLNRSEEGINALAQEINASGSTAIAYKCDVLERDMLLDVHERVNRDLGPCEILINGAGGNNPRGTAAHEFYEPGEEDRDDIITFFNFEREAFDAVFDLNMMGTLLPSQIFARDLVKSPGTSIINISSMGAIHPLTKIPAYSAAKAAMANFTQWLAVFFAPAGIRVNAIAPGFFVTKQNRALLYDSDGNPTARTGKILRSTPMGRFGEPSELIGTLRWLVDPAASGFVTGVIVPVDGGFAAYGGV